MRLNNFENLYADQLNDLFSAESQLIEALPKMAEAATTPELQQAFTQHLEETRQHAETVRGLLSAIGESAGGEKCKGMEGLLKEGKEVLEKRGDPAVKDAALIAAAQRVEHYEIAGYGTARTFALQLGYNDAVNRLQEILNQESDADELLTQIATGEGGAEVAVNQEAASHANAPRGGAQSNASRSSDQSAESRKGSVSNEPRSGTRAEESRNGRSGKPSGPKTPKPQDGVQKEDEPRGPSRRQTR